MTRIFEPAPDMESRALRKTSAPGDPEGWQSLERGYKKISDLYGGALPVKIPVAQQVPGGSCYLKKTGEIYVDSDVLGVNPYELNLNISSHQGGLVSFHGLFLHDLAHHHFSKWDHEFEEEPKRAIASSLEDIRVEAKLASEQPDVAKWLASTAAARADESVILTKDPKARTIVLGLETVGRALLGVFPAQGVADIAEQLGLSLNPAAMNTLIRVVKTLPLVDDQDEKTMVDLVEELWNLTEEPQQQDQNTDPNQDGDPDQNGQEQESEDQDGNQNGENQEGSGEGQGDENAQGEGQEGEGEGQNQPGEGQGEGEGQPGDGQEGSGEGQEGEGQGEADGQGENGGQASGTSLSDAAKAMSNFKQNAEASKQEVKEEELEKLIKDMEEMTGKDHSSDPEQSDQDGDSENGDSQDGEGSEGWGGAKWANIHVRFRAPSGKEQSTRKRLVQKLLRAQWRDREVIRYNDYLPPGKLKTREAVRAEAQAARGEIVSAKPWRATKHRNAETKRLRVAVLSDASGSMSPYVDDFASAAWITISAVRDIGGRSVGIAFGDTVQTIEEDKPAAPTVVSRYPADGGTEIIEPALEKAIEQLDLLDKDGTTGPKLMVIFSDGHWDPSCLPGVHEKMRQLQRANVGIVLIGVEGADMSHPHDEVMELPDASSFNETLGEIMIQAVKEA